MNSWLFPSLSPKRVLAQGGGPALLPGQLQVLPGCHEELIMRLIMGGMTCSMLILQPLFIWNLPAHLVTSLIRMMFNCLVKQAYPPLSIHISHVSLGSEGGGGRKCLHGIFMNENIQSINHSTYQYIPHYLQVCKMENSY